MRMKAALSGGLLTLAILAAPAAHAAEPPLVPFTCGMVVTRDTVVYLTKNITCTAGIEVNYPEGEENPTIPTLTLDLRGHTLRGTGAEFSLGIGGGSDNGDPANLRVINGTVENWYWGIFGGFNTTVENVTLVNNKVGFGCNGGCSLTDSYVARNEFSGMTVADAFVAVHGTTFDRNGTGMSVSIAGMNITDNVFSRNAVGFDSPVVGGTLAGNTFVRNDIAFNAGDNGCADLSGITFVRNGTDLVGTAC